MTCSSSAPGIRSVIEITSCPALRTALTTAKSQLSSATRRIMLGFD
jgi:hypothetical protein